VWQQHHLLPEFSAEENVSMPLRIRGESGVKASTEARASLEEVGLGDRAHHRSGELSGGEQQRIAIARALASNPSLLLADEPTGNLDQATGQSILGLIDQLHQAGSTIVVITHDHAIAERMPRNVEILDGHIVADTGPTAGVDPRLRPLAQPPTHVPRTVSGAPVIEEPS
jgi:predicted ABC-type transport system involved in lysophospholipase L1 biosynthesis ATPase subunit